MPAFPPACSNYVSGARRRRRRGAGRGIPEIAGVTFTGSYEVGMGIAAALRRRAAGRGPASPRWAARTPPSSAAMPTSSAPPPASCARPSACRARSARPARASTWSGRWRRRCASGWWRRREQSPSATRRARENWMGPVISQAARARYRACGRTPGRAGAHRRRRQALHAKAGSRAASSSRRPSPAHRLRRPRCGATRCSCRSCWWARSIRSTRRIARANDSDYGLTAGFYGATGRDRPLPASTSRPA